MPQTWGMSAEVRDPLVETPIRRLPIFEGRLLRVYDDEVRFDDGAVAHREVVEHPGAVCIVALDGSGRVALVRQWRHAIGRAVWELPAGTRDRAGEAPEETARRELLEEVGVTAATWTRLGAWPLAPGYSSEVMHFFLATEFTATLAEPDPDERLEAGWFDRTAAADLATDNGMDVKTLAGLALVGWDLRRG
ncbi:MAG: NUDIX hydrolase [Chloroflexi bacterium]|nr:MAG: NUDIX hydrolase [Chloroflexota bacterium]